MKVNQMVPLGFGVVFVLIVITTVTSQWSAKTLIEATQWVAHTYKVEAELNALEKALVDAETGQRGFIFTNDDDFLDSYNQAQDKLDTLFSALKNEVKDNPKQLQNLETVAKLTQNKMKELAETIRLKKSGKESELKALVLSKAGKQFMDQIRKEIAEMIQIEGDLLAERQQAALQLQQFSAWISWGGMILSIIFGSVIAWMTTKMIMQLINEAAMAIANAVAEISTTVDQQERIATEQASAVNQTSSTMGELNASAIQAAQQAEMSSISARQVAQQVLRLSEQTHQIGNITNVVGDLATQTNMLALNAAVEAVRAGEHGRGFGVVAGEIRRLADASKKSAADISVLITDIQRLTDATATVGGEGKKFESIVVAINNIVMSSQQISLTAKQQAVAIQQVVDSMNMINIGAAQTASGLSQTKVGTQKLNEAAQRLKTLGVG